jgi:hypothetical protein
VALAHAQQHERGGHDADRQVDPEDPLPGQALDDRAARPSGTMSAEPAPWTARAAISQPTVGASAQAADATAKSTRPAAYRLRRPKRSPRAAPVISSTAKLRL